LKALMISSEEGIRLAKRVAAEQSCSRSEAEALIVAGGVQVAGKVVTDPARRVRPEQSVQVNRLVSMAALAPMTLVLFKPAHRVANLAWLQDTVGLKAPSLVFGGPSDWPKCKCRCHWPSPPVGCASSQTT
jgi:23S rRNA pseudouridine2604 synthase